ncbi:unnamed protein product [Orchesella dallaii]|uniref:Puromycin-sensitive aminopeptidase n=1 Tax=Orchesella dallaii TaxID=48710 RepID=A0ABP1RC33_9HEXA
MFPEMEVWTHFVTHSFQKALKIDALRFSHQIEVHVTSVAEIEESVDEICLRKAPALLRMVHRFIGDADFRKGLKLYLERYRFGNATTADFWKCLQEASSKPIVSVMSSWTLFKGYPVITVTSKQEGKNRILKLNQDRFLYDQSSRELKGQGQSWVIPITFSTRHFPLSSVLDVVMDSKTMNVTINDVAKTDWIKINPGSVGYFRVKYPHEMLSLLVYAIRERSLPPLDRLNILDDSFAFLLAGSGTTIEVLTLLEAFVEEDDYSVWTTISNIFDKFLHVFDHVGKAESFQHFGRYLFSNIYSKLGWIGSDDESIQRKLLRSLIIRMMSKFNTPEVVEQCRLLFDAQYSEDSNPIPVDLRFAVYKTVVMYGDENIIKRFMRLYRDCESPEERDKLAYALGSCRSHQQLQNVLEFAISDDVRRAHTIFIITSMAKTKIGREISWGFFKENYAIFRNRYGPHQASTLLHALLEDWVTEEKITEIQEFFKANPYPGTEWALQQIVESIKLNENWLRREKNLTALQDYLESM